MNIGSKIASVLLGCGAMFVLNTVSANEVVATVGASAKNGSAVVALDFASSGEVTTFEFEVTVPKGAVVDTSRCTSELPKSHMGACAFNQKSGRVIVMIYSNTLSPLPQGVVSIGKLGISGGNVSGLKVQNVLVSDKNSKPLEAKATTVDSAK